MIIIDTREPDKIANILSRNRIKELHNIPADELVLEHSLPCGDVLVSLVNKALPQNLAQYLAIAAEYHYEPLPVDEILQNPVDAALKTISEHSMLIERKTVDDLLSSIADGRLFSQAKRLSDACEFPVIAITGTMSEKDGFAVCGNRVTQWSIWSVQMALLRVQAAGCSILHVKESSFSDFICHLWKWILEGNEPIRKPRTRALIPLSDEAEFLCGIPGVGPEKANDVLAYAGNVVNALAFLTDSDSAKLPNRPFGFGKQTIENIKRFFNIDDNSVLAVSNKESIW
jgi:ERCC4-type nuclease